jgi:tetratricopeptide (TPR) repeat protein
MQYVFISKEDKSYLDKAENCVKKVFTLNPESSIGHSLKGNLYLRRGDIQKGIREFRKALEIDPNEHVALLNLGWLYALFGKENEARSLLLKLLEVDPLTPINHMILGAVEVMDGRFNSGLKYTTRAQGFEPENPLLRYWVGIVLAYGHRYEEAYQLFDLIKKETNTSIFAKLGQFLKYALQENNAEALKAVTEDLKSLAKEDEMFPIWMAEGYALIGEKEEAIDWLEQGINYGFIHYSWLSEHDPFLKNIRGEPRFKKLMERVKYEQENFKV